MHSIRSFARSASVLCCAWPLLLFLQLQSAVEMSQKSDAAALPPPEIAENEPPVLTGVVIEEVPEDSALNRAGLQPGDVILSWERLPNPPANPEGASGVIENPFDWMWVEIEQVPRGVVRLVGQRETKDTAWEVPAGGWGARAKARQSLARPTADKKDTAGTENEESQKEKADLKVCASSFVSRCARPAVMLGMKADALIKAGHFEDALRVLQQAQDLASRSGMELGAATYESRLVSTYLLLGELGPARQHLALSKSTLERLAPDSIPLAILLNVEGAIDLSTKNARGALLPLQRSLAIAESISPGSRFEAKVLNNLGYASWIEGDLDYAEAAHRRAATIRTALDPNSSDMASSWHNLGLVMQDKGDRDQAEDLYLRSLKLKSEVSASRLSIAMTEESIADLLGEQGRIVEAQNYRYQALENRKVEAPNSYDYAMSLANIGVAEKRLGNYSKARLFLEQALQRLSQFNPDSPDVAAVLTNLASFEIEGGSLPQAKRLLERALGVAERSKASEQLASSILRSLGIIAERLGKLNEAEDYYSRSLAIRRSLGGASIQVSEALNTMGWIRWKRGNFVQALDNFNEATEVLDRQVSSLAWFPYDRERFRALHAYVYKDLVLALWKSNRISQAADELEKFRAQALREMLSDRARAFQFFDPKKSSVETNQGHAERVGEPIIGSSKWAYLASSSSSPNINNEKKAEDVGASAEQANNTLEAGTVLLSFVTAERGTFEFLSSRDEAFVVKDLHTTEAILRQRVERFRELIPLARPGSMLGGLRLAELRQLGKELYGLLLKPSEAEIEKAQRVMIVADGPLHYLPFAALTREVVGEGGVKHDQYLAEWKPFHSVLSASVFSELKKGRRDPNNPEDGTILQLAAFGDPLFPADLKPREPDKIEDIHVHSAAQQRVFEAFPLPYTRKEVEGIAALFPPNRVQTFIGAEATEERAKAIGKGARILHFATHARLDDRFPLNSSLLLSTPEGFLEGRENGLLQVREIFEQMRLDADLVVLSACDSGLGEEQGGEGLIGLSRAFQYAGARTVLASLWAVRDEATAELMIRFYRHLIAGEPKDRALQAAERELLAGPIEIPGPDGKPIRFDATAPYYWAAFQVIGDWQ